MADEVYTTDGREPHTTIVERRGSGAGLLFGLAALVIVALIAYLVVAQTNTQSKRDDAIASAAKSVEKTADKAGDAIDGATK